MSGPPTRIVMLDFRPCELPKFIKALCSALPGSVWFSEVIHNHDCPLDADKTLVEEDHCTCSVARLVIIKRLRPTQTISGNGGGGRAG